MRTATLLIVLALATGAACLALTPAPVLASDYHDGYEEDGYVYRESYWWKQSYPYHREKVYSGTVYRTGYDYRGCAYTYPVQQYYWRYYPVAGYKSPSKPAASTYSNDDFRKRLLEIAADRDKAEFERRKAALEHNINQEMIEALGLRGNFRMQNYGAAFPYAQGYHNYEAASYIGNKVVEGSTQYGYSTESVLKLYGDTDINALYLQSKQLADGAQQLSGQATAGFKDLAAQAGDQKARVAEILAKGEAARQALEAAKAGNSAELRVTETGSGTSRVPIVGVESNPVGQALGDVWADWQASAKADCAGCHGSDKQKNHGFDVLADYPRMSERERLKRVWPRLRPEDPNRLMPLLADGRPGKPLSAEKFRAWTSLPVKR